MDSSIGKRLRDERERRKLSLEELSQTTRIPLRALLSIEEDRFDALPSDVFARGFLRSYSRALGVDDSEILKRFSELATPSSSPVATQLTNVAPERGRRFGIAIALVILLILFTLAFSIVLRPRHRDVPVELSSRAIPTLTLA